MMLQFHCRENELAKLNARYDGGDFECIVVYGRRRVGKTALISQFCKDKPTIFFSALNTTAQENLDSLSRAVMSFRREGGGAPVFQNYDDVLVEVERLANDGRLVFVIDEYPYLAKAMPAFSAMLQHMIDHRWSKTKLFVILCGSSMSFMEYQVLGRESPLYGRRTGQFKILPLTYREVAVFHPSLSVADKALLYGVTGGIPHYINKLGVSGNLDAALQDNVFDRSAYLFEEPDNLLKQEVREPALYGAIIKSIANGASRMNEIAMKVGVSSATCAIYLKSLSELGIVEKETPIAEKVGRKTVYRLKDSFFRFWYRFVPSNVALIDSGRFADMYSTVVKPYLSDFMGLVFEKMCRDYLLRYAGNLPFVLKEVGPWWGTDPVRKKEVQIDLVGVPLEGDVYLIGSCKYRNAKVGYDELELLREYASVFGKGRDYRYVIFSKGGWTKTLGDAADQGEVTLVSLEDVYR